MWIQLHQPHHTDHAIQSAFVTDAQSRDDDDDDDTLDSLYRWHRRIALSTVPPLWSLSSTKRGAPTHVLLTSDREPSTEDYLCTLNSAAPLRFTYPTPLLKSALQKAVRRCRADAAVALAWQLMRQDMQSFLRRWTIIVLEDAILDILDYATVVWFMMATSRGWCLSRNDVLLLLRMVFRVATHRHHELLPSKLYISVNPFETSTPWHDIEAHDNNDEENDTTHVWYRRFRTAALAMLLRVYYGGMSGDMLLCRAFAALWMKRASQPVLIAKWMPYVLTATSLPAYLRDQETSQRFETKLTPFNVSDFGLLEGVDFHCWPNMLQRIQQEIGNITPTITLTLLKEAMWQHRSGVYMKRFVTRQHDACLPCPVSSDGNLQDSEDDEQAVWSSAKRVKFHNSRLVWFRMRAIADRLSKTYWWSEQRDEKKVLVMVAVKSQRQTTKKRKQSSNLSSVQCRSITSYFQPKQPSP